MKKGLRTNQRGATAIEYGLILALMVVAIIPALLSLNGNNDNMYGYIGNSINAAMTSR